VKLLKKSLEECSKVLRFFQSLKIGLSKDGTVNTTCLQGVGRRPFSRFFDQISAYLFPQELQILELQLFLEQSIIL